MNPFEDPDYRKLKGAFPALEHMAEKMAERAEAGTPDTPSEKPAPAEKKKAGWKPGLEYRLGKNDD